MKNRSFRIYLLKIILILVKMTRISHRRLLMGNQKPLVYGLPILRTSFFWTSNNLSPETKGAVKKITYTHVLHPSGDLVNPQLWVHSPIKIMMQWNLITLFALMKLALPSIKLYYKLLSHHQYHKYRTRYKHVVMEKGWVLALEPYTCILFPPFNKSFNLSRSKFSHLLSEDNGTYLTWLF